MKDENINLFQILLILIFNYIYHQSWLECKDFHNLSFKTGRVVLMTAGRFAGKKAIVTKNYEDGTKVLY